ncbi:LamG-like jellyroll fold domain-containing protein, partial [Nanoarchaeota archaeon]
FWLALWTDGIPKLRFSSTSSDTDCDVSGSTDLRGTGWNYLTSTYNGTHCALYRNGVLQNTDATSSAPEGAGADIIIGSKGGSIRHFNGTIDDVQIFNTSLSAQQIAALYNNRTDLIVSQETSASEQWQCEITPNDGTIDGTTLQSNNLTIVAVANTAPDTASVVLNSTSATNTSSEDLNCYANITDADGDSVYANYTWYRNGAINLTGQSSAFTASTISLIATLDSGNTTKTDNWTCSVNAYDGTDYESDWTNSSTMTILNSAPTQATPILNSTDASNDTNQNLTCNPQTTADADNDAIKNIFNWYKDSASIMVLNMPMEGGSTSGTASVNGTTRDYSGFGYNGTVVGATWNSTGGYDAKGAYEFRHDENDYILINPSNNWQDFTGPFTISLWTKTYQTPGANDGIISSDSNAPWPWAVRFNGDLELLFNGSVLNTGFVPAAGKWYHIVAQWNGTEKIVYIDGEFNASSAQVTGPAAISDPVYIGIDYRPGSSRTWPGTIDDVMVFNSSLSATQVAALYQNRTNLIVSQETATSDQWQCEITPNDGTVDGTTLKSNNLTVVAAAVADTTPPTITFTDPTPADGADINETWATINVTLNENASSCTLIWDGLMSHEVGYSNDTLIELPDNGCPAYLNTTVVVAETGTVASSGIDVYVDMEHDYADDMDIRLVSPDGTEDTLCDADCPELGEGQWADSWFNNRTAFNNKDINGTWTLKVCDGFALDIGNLTLWKLNITYTANSTNYSMSVNNADASTWSDYNVTSLTETTNYTYSVQCTDTSNNTDQTGNRSLVYNLPPGVAWLQGTTLDTGATDLYTASLTLLNWSESDVDADYFSHSGNDAKLTVLEDGDYFIALTIPLERVDTTNSRTGIEAQVFVNNVKHPVGVARSSYIRGAAQLHNFSSDHLAVLLEDLSANDYITVKVIRTTSTSLSNYASENFSLYAEHIPATETVFSATATEHNDTVAPTNLNNATEFFIKWSEGRNDAGITHDDAADPQAITLASAGQYFVTVNIPLGGAVARTTVEGRVNLDGQLIDGGLFRQTYIRNSDSHIDSSGHWAGLVNTTTANQVLTIGVIAVGQNVGSTVTTDSENATIFIQKLPNTGVYHSEATQVNPGTPSDDWNPATPAEIIWATDNLIDTGTYTHSTSTNPHIITVDEAGQYLVALNGAFSSTGARENPRMNIEVNGVSEPGAWSQTGYIRDYGTDEESSDSLVFMLDLSANDNITVNMHKDGLDAAAVNDDTPTTIMIWQKTT